MKVIIGADHAGFQAKEKLISILSQDGHELSDAGPTSAESCDYADFAAAVARAVAGGEHDCGILICGTGIGMSMAANKIKGIRAALGYNILTARLSRLHNDANILCLGARMLGDDVMVEMVREFMKTDFEGGRHARRIGKIANLE